jgi:hypothetical protein
MNKKLNLLKHLAQNYFAVESSLDSTSFTIDSMLHFYSLFLSIRESDELMKIKPIVKADLKINNYFDFYEFLKSAMSADEFTEEEDKVLYLVFLGYSANEILTKY